MRRAIYVIVLTYLASIFFCIPVYFTFAIKPREESQVCFESICNSDHHVDALASFLPPNILKSSLDGIYFTDKSINDNLTNFSDCVELCLDKKFLNNSMLEFNSKLPDRRDSFGSELFSNNERTKRESNQFAADNFLKNDSLINKSSNSHSSVHDSSINLDEWFSRIREEKFIKQNENNEFDDSKSNQKNEKMQLNQSQLLIRCYNYLIEDFYKKWGIMQLNSKNKSNFIQEFENFSSKKLPANCFWPGLWPEEAFSETYRVTFSDIALANNGIIKKFNFWIYSVLSKLIPCCALTYLSLALIRMLYASNERRHRLRSYGKPQFYSQVNSLSYYSANPIQNQLTVVDSNSKKFKENDCKKDFKHQSNNSLNPTLSDQKEDNLSKNQTKSFKENECSNNLITTNDDKNSNSIPTSASKSDQGENEQDKEILQIQNSVKNSRFSLTDKLKPKTNLQTELNSNQSFNQTLNASRNNSSTSYIYPTCSMNKISSFNKNCKMNNNTNCDRTTKMLLGILFLFLITEIPSGILNLLAGILGEVMDLLALINNGVNFILYCTMSRQFRKIFQKTFCCNCICFLRPIVKNVANKSMNERNTSQQQIRMIPNEKVNLLNQKLNHDNLLSEKKVSLNEIDDDDQELVTMNETKQNSSTIEVDDEAFGENEENNIRFSKNLPKQQEIILESSREIKENSELESSVELVENNSKESPNNEFVIQENENKKINEKAQLSRKKDDSTKVYNSEMRIHRNSSIDSTCDRIENRRTLLHRYNDSRKRRRKTIANLETDYKTDNKNTDTSFTTCV